MDPELCRGLGDKSSCAAKAEGLGTVTPAPSRGSCSPKRGEKCLSKVGISKRPYRKEAIIE